MSSPIVGLIFFNSGGQCKTSYSNNLKIPFDFEESPAQKPIEKANPKEHCLLV